ncbi:MAG: hypothetical protein HFJ30_06460 [Clostridia bacterium]|jgi:UDP-N-acetylglucosamine/UDP-N-acetylgalactosamine diphosphorylase|nr:hypothetical protein [Clostridia bacterium]MCI9413031.1 hypothetical protein [Clostridia bacterium]
MKEQTIETLKKYSQEHLIEYLPYLTEEEQKKLEQQVEAIDFEQLQQLYELAKQEQYMEEKNISHIPYVDKEKLDKQKREELETIGRKIISDGKYAVITMAGGQGTRLGHQGPKGTYCLDTINGPKYLFEITVDTLKRAREEYNVTIPWYIMTSRENHQDTIRFFEEKKYFGYSKSKVKFFTQGELPLISTEGKVILGEDKKIKEAANGNGGIYEAIAISGVLKELQEQQSDWIFINSMDNVLCNFVDPLLLGLTIEQNYKIASKSVAKATPKERAGVFCKMNEKPKVIEYTELPDKMAEERDKNGELVYGELHIMLNLFHCSILEDLANVKLPYHVAFKKSGYLNEKCEYIEPEEPNVYKFEAFIFDAFTRYDDMTILRVKREEEFAPVKNRTGVDSPETATALYNKYYC